MNKYLQLMIIKYNVVINEWQSVKNSNAGYQMKSNKKKCWKVWRQINTFNKSKINMKLKLIIKLIIAITEFIKTIIALIDMFM